MSAQEEIHGRLAPIPGVLGRNLALLRRLTEGVDEVAARTATIPGGSHLAWLLAHLVTSRDGLLGRIGAERVWDAETAGRFGRGSDPAASEYPPLAELLTLLEEQQGRIAHAVEAIVAGAADGVPDAERLASVEFLVWHETYHLGQATLYRRAAGLASPIG